MAKIITVTANTALDFIVDVKGLTETDNLQAEQCLQFACGKGINVGKAVEALGVAAICLGFAGSASLPAFAALDTDLLQTSLLAVDGITRTNITLRDTGSNRETHIRTPGFTVTDNHCRQLLERLESHVEVGDVVVFSGSLPSGAPENYYRSLIELCHARQAITVLDGSGQPLREGLKAGPYLSKPNQRELEELVGRSLTDADLIAKAARSLLQRDRQWLVVSRGYQGAVAVSRKSALTLRIAVPPIKALSHVGCGDAMIAGLAVAMLQGMTIDETFRLGVACGTANLSSLEPGRLDGNRIPELMARVEMTAL